MSHKYRSQRERPAWGASFLLLFYLLLCTATAGHCTAPNETRPTSKKIIAVIPPDAPPQYFRDETTGQASGISVDIMNEVARRGGFAVEYIFAGSWDLMEQAVLSKKADLVPNLTIDEKRLKSLIFTVPVETLKISLIARASDTVHNRIESGMKIGAMKESSVYHFLSKRDDVTLYPYPGLQPLLLDLLAGRVDLAVAPAPNMIKLARDANIEDRIRIIEPCLYEAKRGMALRPGNEALRDQLNTVINEFFATLAYQKLYQRWWGIPAPFWNTRRVTGTIAGVVTVLVTIFMVLRFRERRLTNEKLQKSEQKYRQFVETANEGVWAIDAEQRTTFVNRCMAEMLGYMPEEMLGKNVEIFIFDEDLPEHHARMDQRKQGHGGAYERRLRHKDGSEVWARVSATAIIDAENRFAGSHALFTDITQRKQAEKSLVIFKESLDNSADAIGMATVQGRHYYQNKAFSELFGTIGENPFNDVYVDKTIGEEVYRTIMSGQVWTGEVKLYAKDRKVLDFHLRAYATKDDSGNITNLVGIHTDISERKFAEKIIRRRERLLIGLNNAAQALLYSQDTIPFQKVIEQIGPASKADRASIFINHHGQEGNLSMRRIAEWCAKGIRSEIDNPLSRGVS